MPAAGHRPVLLICLDYRIVIGTGWENRIKLCSATRMYKKIFFSLAVIALAGAGAFHWYSQGPKLLFTTASIKRGDVSTSIGATGTLEPIEVVDVGAQVAGRISTFGTDTDGKIVDY